MADREKDNDFYGELAKAANFIHDRTVVDEPIGLNNTVDEYMEEEAGEEEPNIAPGMHTNDEALEENATEEDIRNNNSTPVTRLYLDRTPED